MQNVLAKMEMYTKKRDRVKNMRDSSAQNDIYIKDIKMFQQFQPPVVELAVL